MSLIPVGYSNLIRLASICMGILISPSVQTGMAKAALTSPVIFFVLLAASSILILFGAWHKGTENGPDAPLYLGVFSFSILLLFSISALMGAQ